MEEAIAYQKKVFRKIHLVALGIALLAGVILGSIGVLLGWFFGAVSLIVFEKIAGALLIEQKGKVKSLLFLFTLKIGVLMGAGWLLLYSDHMSPLSFLLGYACVMLSLLFGCLYYSEEIFVSRT